MPAVSPGYNTSIRVTGTAVSVTGESLTDTGDGLRWEIPDSALSKSIWDPAAEVSVYVNGSEVGEETYDIEYLVGAIIFDADQSGATVTVDFDYFPTYLVDLGKSVEHVDSYTELDATRFFDTAERIDLGQRSNQITIATHTDTDPLPLDGSGGTEKTLAEIIDDGDAVILEFGPSGTDTATEAGARQGRLLRCYAKFADRTRSTETGSMAEDEQVAQPYLPPAANTGQRVSPIQTREV